MIRKRILNKWASSRSSSSLSSSSSPPLSPATTSTSLSSSSSSLWRKHSFSYNFVTSNISFTVTITVIITIVIMIFVSIVNNIIPHIEDQQQFVSYSNSSYSSLMKKKNSNNSNDTKNNTSTNNSSYYTNNSNIYYDQYLEEASSLRCTPLSDIFTDQRPSSSLLQSLLSYFNFNYFKDNVFIIEDDDYDHYYAVCEFLKNRPNSQHFPHTMQQLYPCFSFWLWNTNKARNKNINQDIFKIMTSNVLIIKELHVQDDNNKNSNIPIINEFANGFLTALTASSSSSSLSLFNLDLQLVNKIKIVGKYNTNFNSSNVSVVHVDDYIDEYHMDAMFRSSSIKISVNNSKDLALPAYTMHHPNDAKMMRQIIFDYYNITTARRGNININNSNNNNTTMMTEEVELCRLIKEPSEQDQDQDQQEQIRTKRIIPVIGFLNRKKSSGRYVTNHVSIVKALEEEFYHNTSANNDTTNNVNVVHYLSNFDGVSFVDQISYMNTIDILIGPHGAQFTSIPFLSECSGILELFPIGYYIPTFFGSLSRSTGHYHISYYTGGTNNTNNITSINNNRVRVRLRRNEEIRLGHQTLQTRKVSRRKTIIADPHIIIHGVKKLISNWQSCQCMTDVEKDSCTNNW